jgi:DNA-binding Lrp family transcriptional regulator
LATPSTPADRKRRRILQVIERTPGASNRAIAQIAGCDPKTVAKLRGGADKDKEDEPDL